MWSASDFQSIAIYLELVGWLVGWFIHSFNLSVHWKLPVSRHCLRYWHNKIDQDPLFPIACDLLISLWLCQFSLQVCKCQIVNLGGKGHWEGTDFVIKTYRRQISSTWECQIWPLKFFLNTLKTLDFSLIFWGLAKKLFCYILVCKCFFLTKNYKGFHD